MPRILNPGDRPGVWSTAGDLLRRVGILEAEPCCVEAPPQGESIDNVIAGLDPAGWWKLDESSGHVAHDSSGNGFDMTSAVTGGQDPTWGAAAGPPGTQTADFQTGTGGMGGTAGREAIDWPLGAITGAFTAGIFANRNSTASQQVFGQGDLSRAGGSGWQFEFENPSTGAGNRALFGIKNVGSIECDNAVPISTWVFLAGTYDGTTMKMYVNGLLQSTTHTGTASGAPGPFTLWIGQDGGAGGTVVTVPAFVGSYAFVIPSTLSGAEILSIYNSAVIPGGSDIGKVLTATGLGGSDWEFPLEVTF